MFALSCDEDDEDADEETRLAPGRSRESPAALGFHAGFLDDEEGSASGTPGPRRYRDEPVDDEKHERSPTDMSGSGSGGSADGSWEHASQMR